jgi:hypothetical protein
MGDVAVEPTHNSPGHHGLPAISQMAQADFSESAIPLLAGTAFADNLGSNITDAFKQVVAGLRSAEKMTNVIGAIADKEIKCQAEIDKLIVDALAAQPDGVTGAWASYMTLLTTYQKAIKQRKKFGQLLQLKICTPMKKFLEQEKTKLFGMRKSFQDFAEPIPNLVRDIDFVREKCIKSIAQANDEKSNSMFNKKGGNKWNKVFQECREFDDKRQYANQYLNSFFETHVPQTLTSLQRIEERRLAAFVNIFDIFSSVFTDTLSAMESQTDRFSRLAASIDIEKDLADFVVKVSNGMSTDLPKISGASILSNASTKSLSSEGKSASDEVLEKFELIENLEKFLPYGLPLQLIEIENRSLVESAKSSNKPLIDITDPPETIVEQQSRLLGNAYTGITLPRIFLALKVAVEDLGGLEKEGIFRISSPFGDLDKAYERLRTLDFDNVEIKDPYLAANCLKKWLRELKDGLIHSKLVDSVLQALEVSTSDLQKGEELIIKVFEKLPKTNQMIIKGCLRLMRDISFQENVAHTKMTMQNLAVVFGPSFLRCDDIKDQKKAFKVAESAQQLVLSLVTCIDVQDYPVDQERKVCFPKVNAVEGSWKRAPLTLRYTPSTETVKMGAETKSAGKDNNQDMKSDTAVGTNKNKLLAQKWSSKQVEAFNIQKTSKPPGSALGGLSEEPSMSIEDAEIDELSQTRVRAARLILNLEDEDTDSLRDAWSSLKDEDFKRDDKQKKDTTYKKIGASSPDVITTDDFSVDDKLETPLSPPRKGDMNADLLNEAPKNDLAQSLKRVARCWKCQAKATNSEYCINCWTRLDPVQAIQIASPIESAIATTSIPEALSALEDKKIALKKKRSASVDDGKAFASRLAAALEEKKSFVPPKPNQGFGDAKKFTKPVPPPGRKVQAPVAPTYSLPQAGDLITSAQAKKPAPLPQSRIIAPNSEPVTKPRKAPVPPKSNNAAPAAPPTPPSEDYDDSKSSTPGGVARAKFQKPPKPTLNRPPSKN